MKELMVSLVERIRRGLKMTLLNESGNSQILHLTCVLKNTEEIPFYSCVLDREILVC